MPLNVQPLAGGESLHVAAHEAEKAVATHSGAGSFLLSGVRVACAQQIGVDDEQSDAVVQSKEAFIAQVAAQAFVCAARLAQQIWPALHFMVVPLGPQVGPDAGGGPASPPPRVDSAGARLER